MSARIGMNKFRLTSLVRLSYLAPGIIRALLAGWQPIALTPTRLLRLSKELPHNWQEQRHFLGFKARRNARHPTTRKCPGETRRPFAAHNPAFGGTGWNRCPHWDAKTRNSRDYFGEYGN
jgi:hypothetical protein